MPAHNTPNRHQYTTALFQLLADDELAAIKAAATLKRYTAGQLIHSRGDNKPGLSVIKSGQVSIGVYGIDGVFVMTSILGPDEAFGEFTLFTDLPRTHDVSALVDVEVYQVAPGRVSKLCDQQPTILRALLKSTLTRTHLLLEMLDAMRRLPLLERTAKTLLSLSYTAGLQTELRCRQNDLSHTLGVSRVTLGKVLQQLQKEELIEIGYGKIKIVSRVKLEAWLESRNTTPLR